MVPGCRDDFVRIFDRHFVESQEDLGVSVIGQFRDLDREHRYVWIRGFADMDSRRDSLAAFYDGPVWAEHKDAANATMTEWHDVLLLRPSAADSGFALDASLRPGADGDAPAGLLTAIIMPVVPDRIEAAAALEARLASLTASSGSAFLAGFVTEPAANTYPRLPVRDDESVVVCFVRHPDEQAQRVYTAILATDAGWHAALIAAGCSLDAVQALRLAPTPRSLLR